MTRPGLDLDALRNRLRSVLPAEREAAADELVAVTGQLQARVARIELGEALRVVRAAATEPTRFGEALRTVLADYDSRGEATPTRLTRG